MEEGGAGEDVQVEHDQRLSVGQNRWGTYFHREFGDDVEVKELRCLFVGGEHLLSPLDRGIWKL